MDDKADKTQLPVPGETLNPGGAHKHHTRYKNSPRITQVHLSAIMGRYMNMTLAELREAETIGDLTSMEHMVVSVAIKAIETGDYSRMNALLDRAVGKVKEVVEAHHIEHGEIMQRIPREEILRLLKASKE